jgi:hypothetical protein
MSSSNILKGLKLAVNLREIFESRKQNQTTRAGLMRERPPIEVCGVVVALTTKALLITPNGVDNSILIYERWIPRSQIVASRPSIDDINVGNYIEMLVSAWLVKKILQEMSQRVRAKEMSGITDAMVADVLSYDLSKDRQRIDRGTRRLQKAIEKDKREIVCELVGGRKFFLDE